MNERKTYYGRIWSNQHPGIWRNRTGYLAVSLIEGDEIQEGVYIYRYHNAEDGDVVVEQITLPAEYKKVTKFYEQM